MGYFLACISCLLFNSWILVVIKEMRFDNMTFNKLRWKLRINVFFRLWLVTTFIWCLVLCFLAYQWWWKSSVAICFVCQCAIWVALSCLLVMQKEVYSRTIVLFRYYYVIRFMLIKDGNQECFSQAGYYSVW